MDFYDTRFLREADRRKSRPRLKNRRVPCYPGTSPSLDFSLRLAMMQPKIFHLQALRVPPPRGVTLVSSEICCRHRFFRYYLLFLGLRDFESTDLSEPTLQPRAMLALPNFLFCQFSFRSPPIPRSLRSFLSNWSPSSIKCPHCSCNIPFPRSVFRNLSIGQTRGATLLNRRRFSWQRAFLPLQQWIHENRDLTHRLSAIRKFSSQRVVMAGVKIDGTAIAKNIRERLNAEIQKAQESNPRFRPSLVIFQGKQHYL